MEELKPKSVRTLGVVIAVISAVIIFGNIVGIVVFKISSINNAITDLTIGEDASDDIKILFFVIKHYVEMFLIIATLGMCFLIGGINLRKYKLWANRLISILSLILICIIWFLMITIFSIFYSSSGLDVLSYSAIFSAIIWSVPLIILIRFLNNNEIEMHFE